MLSLNIQTLSLEKMFDQMLSHKTFSAFTDFLLLLIFHPGRKSEISAFILDICSLNQKSLKSNARCLSWQTFSSYHRVDNAGNVLAVLILLGQRLWRQLSAREPVDMPKVTLYMSSSLNFIPTLLIKMRSLTSPTCDFLSSLLAYSLVGLIYDLILWMISHNYLQME